MIYFKSALLLHTHHHTVLHRDHLVIQTIANSPHTNPGLFNLFCLDQINNNGHPSSMPIRY